MLGNCHKVFQNGFQYQLKQIFGSVDVFTFMEDDGIGMGFDCLFRTFSLVFSVDFE